MDNVISAVIVNYNAGPLLKNCVASLMDCPLAIEVIVVDNSSSDGSLAALDAFSDVTIIRNSTNLGFSAGCNIGLNIASAEHILFLNPDCSFLPGTISELLDYLETHDQVGMVGGLLVDPDGTEQAGGRRAVPTPWRTLVRTLGLTRFSDRWPRLFQDFNLHKQPLPDEPLDVEAISGACMLIKRAALEQVGPWDEGYFLHCEDLDYCMRFRIEGWKIAFVPSARIVHEQGTCSRSRPVFVEWHKHKGMVRFYRKFFRHQYPGVLWVGVLFGVWLRFLMVSSYYVARPILFKGGIKLG